MPEGGESNLIGVTVSYHCPFVSLTPPSKTLTRERNHTEKPLFISAVRNLGSRVKHWVEEEEPRLAIHTLNICV